MSIILALGALAVSYLATRWILANRRRLFALDVPNDRSLHADPTPTGGGLAIFLAVFGAFLIIAATVGKAALLGWLSAGTLLVLVISGWDDRLQLSPLIRLVVHVLAATILWWAGLTPTHVGVGNYQVNLAAPLAVVLMVLFVVWLVNLYNFMDGMDGFAGGMSVLGFASLAVLGVLADATVFSFAALAIAAASAGFLFFNFPPARIFMGDVGASPLGYLAAAMILWANRDGIFPFWIGVLVFSPFVIDATVTLVKRLVRREKVWQAHRNHYYQRLAQAGLGHKGTVLRAYLLMGASGVSALLLAHAHAWLQVVGLLAWLSTYIILVLVCERVIERNKDNVKL